VEEICPFIKHMMLLGLMSIMSTCGSTARMGDGPGPSSTLVLTARLAPISLPVLALTPRVRLLILRGVHARTVALRSAQRRLPPPLPLPTPTS
jgi:hypothetical protein